MADFYDIDFNLQTENLLNPLHRAQQNLDFVGSIASNLQYQHGNIFGDFRNRAVYPDYSGATSYTPGNRVIFTDKGVYENIKASTGVAPSGEDLSPTHWRQIQKYYLGVTERSQYNGQIIAFIKAINDWFGVTSAPYIYLVNNNNIGSGYAFFFPLAVYNSLGPTNTDRDNVILKFTDRYTCAGITYNITTY